jgi:hypothetical protein
MIWDLLKIEGHCNNMTWRRLDSDFLNPFWCYTWTQEVRFSATSTPTFFSETLGKVYFSFWEEKKEKKTIFSLTVQYAAFILRTRPAMNYLRSQRSFTILPTHGKISHWQCQFFFFFFAFLWLSYWKQFIELLKSRALWTYRRSTKNVINSKQSGKWK